ncbi:MAG: hypothetical protein M3092_02310 [Actinomycetia bacterium]|nr:hypothetical protein [Actinomycetes bacterium]
MNDADLDIILGITNGRLTGQHKQDALDLIAADPELSEELAIQVTAMDELGALEPAHMTPSEKLALRNSLVEQLHLEPAVPLVRASKQSRPWWQFALASAAALLVVIVVVPSMLSGGDNSSSDVVAIAPEATETVESDVSRGDTDAETKTETTSAAAGGAAATASTTDLPHITEDDVQEFFAGASAPIDTESTTSADDLASAGSEDAADETIAPSASSLAESEEIAVDLVRIEECLTELALDLPGGEHIAMAATLDSGVTTIHFGVVSGSDIAYSVSIELETCTITLTTP